MSNKAESTPKPRYVWPWFLLAGVLLGVVLAVVFMTAEVRRVREQRQYELPRPVRTNSKLSEAPKLQLLFVVEEKQGDQVFGLHRKGAHTKVVDAIVDFLSNRFLDLVQRPPS